MKHYSIEQWADYTRGIVSEPVRGEMAGHLATACAQCQRMVSRLRATASGMAEIEVPEAFLARARAIFPAAPPRESPLRALAAALTFDSLGSAVPQGVRSAAPSIRRLAYSVEDFRVELMVDPGTTKGTVIVTGQISSHTDPAAPRYRIRLVLKNNTMHQTEASELGEFQLEFAPSPGMRLVILDAGANRQIEVPFKLLRSNRPSAAKSATPKSNPPEAL